MTQPEILAVTKIFENSLKVPTENSRSLMRDFVVSCANRMMVCPFGWSQDEVCVRKFYVETCMNAMLRTEAVHNGDDPETIESFQVESELLQFREGMTSVQETVLRGVDILRKGATTTHDGATLAPEEVEKHKRNRILTELKTEDERIIQLTVIFGNLVKRGVELLRKLTTRKARRCFQFSVEDATDEDHGFNFVQIKDGAVKADASKRDLQNLNEWYTEFCGVYEKRNWTFQRIFYHVARCKQIMESDVYRSAIVDAAFEWSSRLQPFLLHDGEEETIFFVKEMIGECTLKRKDDKDKVPENPLRFNFKEGVLLHFFNIPPNIILQVSVAKQGMEKHVSKIKDSTEEEESPPSSRG
ncbi:MAG: uncharacterized protein KVP18_000232 [Porospora cf. gigantea A]|uniref:uncharacterized protein n=1 Tax=Porospora cf. gigantea A TaxID=2853593 RepID=UPI00355A6241|nr:MAG: hypothetical protein KVP18_000232 [Porospora cf. gigantea A]